MSEKKLNFNDYRLSIMSEEEAKDLACYSNDLNKTTVLKFVIDPYENNLISKYEGLIVIVDRDYKENVHSGEVWLCSLSRRHTSYVAVPLLKISSTILLGLSPEVGNVIINQIWEENKSDYLPEFEKKYKEEAFAEGKAAGLKEMKEKIDALTHENNHLRAQNAQDRLIIESYQYQPSTYDAEKHELSSVDGSDNAPQQESTVRTANVAPQRPRWLSYDTAVEPTPGFPSMRMPEHPLPLGNEIYEVRRTGADTISSPSFENGKYFAHINTRCSYVVIRPSPFGSVTCTDHVIELQGLRFFSDFDGEKQLVANSSDKYGGMLIYLD